MKNSNYFKIASTLLALLVFAGCASLPVQQSEYDDVYFTSADRAQPKKVVINPEDKGDLGENVVTLENSSTEKVDAQMIDKYNNGSPSEVVYFEEIEPRVSKASDLNYNDFVWDYDNELLRNYDLPLDWNEMDAISFNQIVRDDFQFRRAWYEQYYLGNTRAMETYANNFGISNRAARNFNVNLNLGLGLGFGSFYSPYGTSVFYGNSFYDSFWSYRSIRYNPYWGYDPFYNPGWGFGFNTLAWGYPSYRWRRNLWYGRPNTIIVSNSDYYNRGGRSVTRSGRVRSTSITSVRADANSGTNRTRSSAAISNGQRSTRSTISRGRVSNNSVRPTTVTRSSRSSVDEALDRTSRRVSTDAYRFNSRTRSSNNSSFRISSVRRSSSNSVGRTSRTSSRTSFTAPSSIRNTRTSSRRGLSFNRSSSSRSSSFGSSRSSSNNRSFSRSSSGSSRSSGSSMRRSSGSSSRSSGSSVRSGGSSRSSGGSSRSSSGSSRSSSSSSSRSGRGN